MTNPQFSIREHILDMPPYEPILPFEVLSEQLGIPADRLIKLDANENPYGALPEVSEALRCIPYLHVYPDPESRILRQAISCRHSLPAGNIIAGAGSDELIDLIMRLFLEPGDAVLTCPPTFGMYTFDAGLHRAHIIQIPRLDDFSLDLDAVERVVISEKPRIIFLASPNNPDGSLLSKETVERLLALPCMLVLDEAYIEFASTGASLIAEAPERSNLIVLRTFSKWAGLAGLRVGFGVFPDWIAPQLWKIKQPYNVSVAASTAALVSLEHADKLEEIGKRITTERKRFFNMLQKISWLKPYPSQANFILCRVRGMDARVLKMKLAKRGILVRYFDKPGIQDCIRISIGKPEQSDVVVKALEESYQKTEAGGQ
ncbi:MAG: histidinol-phosphate transaminase [Chloroflexi bacterium]|nr:MAG: histidinol-phosphate transaminase [Chloroflexota bacterium]